MRPEALHGKILALMKEYHWRKVPDSFERQFLTGGDPRRPFSGIGLTYWLTRRGFDVLDELARMLVAAQPALDLDEESAGELVEKVVQANATNRDLFRRDSFMRGGTLFDSRASTPAELASNLLALIWQAARAAVVEWLVVVPLPEVISTSVSLGFDGIDVIAAGDDAAWKRISADFASGSRWDSRTGYGDPRDSTIMAPMTAPSWLACRVSGTTAVARNRGRERMRTFLSLVFASLHIRGINVLLKTAATNSPMGFLFPETGSHKGYIHTAVGDLLPSIATDVTLDLDIINLARTWYGRRADSDPSVQKRATVASHFAHYALVTDGLEQFVHFFIALDAMFGERGNVEHAIAQGVKRVFTEPSWEQRARRLFDLRSELLHGGASDVTGWAGHASYARHFRSSPNDDVAALALRSLAQYPC